MAIVLLVEDNENIMNINETALIMKGYEVIKAYSIDEARNKVLIYSPDIVVLDVMLPDGNGIDFCKEIKSGLNIPVLFLSALGSNHDIIEGLQTGDDYLG